MPELRLVVLALQDRLAYGPTFEAAMAGLFGRRSTLTGDAPQRRRRRRQRRARRRAAREPARHADLTTADLATRRGISRTTSA